MTKLVFIDADPIRYRVGFAGEIISYEAVLEDDSGNLHRFYFEATEKQSAYDRLKKFMYEHDGWELLHKEKKVEILPWFEVEQMLNAQIDSIKKEIREHFKLDKRDIDFVFVLSGSGNFRDELATLKVYKGNRDKSHRPQHYAKLTEVLLQKHGSLLINGHEADDEISIRSWDMIRTGRGDDFVLATIDKDLDQIPGFHYDYQKKVFYHVSGQEARMWFWQQVLSGDATDNIGGACKIGPKKAVQILEDAYQLQDDDLTIWKTVVSVYAKACDVPGCYHAEVIPEQAALENARLVYLLREEGEVWNPPSAS